MDCYQATVVNATKQTSYVIMVITRVQLESGSHQRHTFVLFISTQNYLFVFLCLTFFDTNLIFFQVRTLTNIYNRVTMATIKMTVMKFPRITPEIGTRRAISVAKSL
jgi:hypothetical protein